MSWPTRLIHWSFYALAVLVPLIFLPNTSELFEFNKIIVAYFLTALIACLWLAEIILQKRFVLRRTPLDWPLLAFLAIQLLSTAASISPHVSWYGYYSRWSGGFLSLICYSLLYWAAVTFLDRKSTLKFINFSLLIAVLVAAWGVAEHFGADASKWVQDVQSRVFSTLGQPNWLAAYLVALIFIPTSHILTNPKKLVISHWSLVILLFVTLLFTKSRSGLLAFAISSLIFWGIHLWQSLKIKKSPNYLVIGIWLLVICVATLVTHNPIRERILPLFNAPPSSASTSKAAAPALEYPGTESSAIRRIVWTGAIRIWQDGPKNLLLGSGPETFAMAYYQHRPKEHNQTSEWELLYNKAHNEFLNLLANTGLLGLLSYLVLLGFMGLSFIKFPGSTKPNSLFLGDWSLVVALFCGWLSISVTNFWGFSVVILQIFLFTLPALVQTLASPSSPVPTRHISKSQIFLLFIPLSIFGYLATITFRYWLADVKFATGAHDQKAFGLTQDLSYLFSSYSAYAAAYNLNPREPSIASDFSLVAAYLSLLSDGTDATASADFKNIAISTADLAISANPYHPNYYKSRARTYIILASIDPKYYEDADSTLEKAALISPTDPKIPYQLALLALYRQDPESAKKYFDQASAPDMHPAYATGVGTIMAQYATSSGIFAPEE